MKFYKWNSFLKQIKIFSYMYCDIFANIYMQSQNKTKYYNIKTICLLTITVYDIGDYVSVQTNFWISKIKRFCFKFRQHISEVVLTHFVLALQSRSLCSHFLVFLGCVAIWQMTSSLALSLLIIIIMFFNQNAVILKNYLAF